MTPDELEQRLKAAKEAAKFQIIPSFDVMLIPTLDPDGDPMLGFGFRDVQNPDRPVLYTMHVDKLPQFLEAVINQMDAINDGTSQFVPITAHQLN